MDVAMSIFSQYFCRNYHVFHSGESHIVKKAVSCRCFSYTEVMCGCLHKVLEVSNLFIAIWRWKPQYLGPAIILSFVHETTTLVFPCINNLQVYMITRSRFTCIVLLSFLFIFSLMRSYSGTKWQKVEIRTKPSCTLPSFPRIRELRNLSSRLPSSTIAFLGRSDISFQVCCIARKRILYSLDGVGKKRWHGGVVPIGGTTPARKTSTD